MVIGGELTDVDTLSAALAGCDAVLCVIGPPQGPRGMVGVDLMQRTLPTVSQAMRAAGVGRLVLLSAYGVGDSARTASPIARLAYRTAVRSAYGDKEIAEATLADTGLEVSTVYPVILTDGPPDEGVAVRDLASVSRVRGLPKIPRANVANAMLDAVETSAIAGTRLLVTTDTSLA